MSPDDVAGSRETRLVCLRGLARPKHIGRLAQARREYRSLDITVLLRPNRVQVSSDGIDQGENLALDFIQ